MRDRTQNCHLGGDTGFAGEITVKITEVIAHPLSVEYEQGSWTAHEYMDRAQLILVEVRTDQGVVGFEGFRA